MAIQNCMQPLGILRSIRQAYAFRDGCILESVCASWSGSETTPLIDLGKDRESVRTYLLGQSPFPQNIVLTIGASPPPVKMISFHIRTEVSNPSATISYFMCRALNSRCSSEEPLPLCQKQSCFATNPLHPILVCDLFVDHQKCGSDGDERRSSCQEYCTIYGQESELRQCFNTGSGVGPMDGRIKSAIRSGPCTRRVPHFGVLSVFGVFHV